MRLVAIGQLPGGTSGPQNVPVSPQIDLGTADAPLVKPGQTIRYARRADDTYIVTHIDPQEEITKVSDLLEFALDISAAHNVSHLWWRGQPRVEDANGVCKLMSSVHRRKQPRPYEITITSRFMAMARSRHKDCPRDDAIDEWIFLMQHYGLPTRLLDWTESPLVAAFFAVNRGSEGPDQMETEGSIWALNPYSLNECQMKSPRVVSATSREALPLLRPAFEIDVAEPPEVLAVTAVQIDPRMLAQSAAFTLHGSSISLEEVQDAGSFQFLHRATIPASAKKRLRRELDALGVRRANLFPDLQNLAKELSDLTVS